MLAIWFLLTLLQKRLLHNNYTINRLIENKIVHVSIVEDFLGFFFSIFLAKTSYILVILHFTYLNQNLTKQFIGYFVLGKCTLAFSSYCRISSLNSSLLFLRENTQQKFLNSIGKMICTKCFFNNVWWFIFCICMELVIIIFQSRLRT